jgi:hypothetical protein
MSDGSRFHVDDPRFDDRRRDEPAVERVEWIGEPPRKQRSLLSTCLIGCLITFVMLLAVVGVGVWWLTQNWREVASAAGSEMIKEGINATELPDQEKAELAVEVDRVAEAVRAGDLTPDQIEMIFNEIIESPLMTTLAASAIESKYIAGSGLSDKEKDEGRQTLRRFIRGGVDGAISQGGVDDAMQHVAIRNGDGNWELRDRVSDEDLRAFFVAAKDEADAAEIPAEAEDIDPSDEFRRIIDEAMQVR